MQPKLRLKPICILLTSVFAHGAFAQDSGTIQTEEISVFGKGQTRQVQAITKSDMDQLPAGSSPFKALEKLPGVNFQSADPFGAYEWSTRLNVRGFNQRQMGFTLDDVPLGNMDYANNNGLHISRAISSENIARATISQGAGALGTASVSNLGGTIQFVSVDPHDIGGFSVAQTLGSYSTARSFIRWDSGRLDSGTKVAASYTNQRANKWTNGGHQNQDQFNFKLVHLFGENRISAFYDYSNRREADYQDLTPGMVQRLGWNWDNYYPDWQRAVNAAKGIYSGGVTNVDDAYYDASGLRRDQLFGTTFDLKMTDAARLKTTFYAHHNAGQGHWFFPGPGSPIPSINTLLNASVPIAERVTSYSLGRQGVISALTWKTGRHTVNGGIWAERNLHTVGRDFHPLTGPTDVLDWQDYLVPGKWGKQEFTQLTTQLHLQDTFQLDERTKINFGFKSPHTTINAKETRDPAVYTAARASGKLVAEKSFLPQLGVNYTLTSTSELFASYAENMRAFEAGANGNFATSQASFDATAGNLKPETSTSVDFGYRLNTEQLQGSVALYAVDFKDRELAISQCVGIGGCPYAIGNVGKVQTRGLEAALKWNLSHQLSWFNSLTLNTSQYKSDYLDNGVLVRTSGKDVVDAPRTMLTTELGYEQGNWYGRANGKYTDKRYYTYTNDQSVPAYWVFNLAAGYKEKKMGMLHDLDFQFNVVNLFNKRYFSTVGTNGFAASDPTASNASAIPNLPTVLVGAPRQVFFTVSAKL